MASRHSRLALKGNTYTQIGLKVCYASKRSGRRWRGVGGKGRGRGDGLSWDKVEVEEETKVCETTVCVWTYTHTCVQSECSVYTYTLIHIRVCTRTRTYIHTCLWARRRPTFTRWFTGDPEVQCAQPLRTRESLQKCSTHFRTNHCQTCMFGDKFNWIDDIAIFQTLEIFQERSY